MTPDKTIEIKSAVITLKPLHDGRLVVMDKSGNLRLFDSGSYKAVGGFKTGIAQERSWGNHMSVSASGKYAASIIPRSNRAALYDIETKKLLYTTSRHKGDLESVCVDDNNHYIVTGGTDGKTYVWSLETGRLVYSFPPHADYITALDINNIWIVSASYDKTISVLNLTTMKLPTRLRGHSSVVIQMKLLKNMRMLSIDKEGNLILWNLKSSKIIQRFTKTGDEATCFVISADEKFLFVGTKLGNVTLYEIEKGELLKRSYIKEQSKVTALTLMEAKGQLLVGTKEGRLSFYSHVPNEGLLLLKLKNKEYLELYEAADENPLLYYSSVYLKLEEIWEAALIKATKMLELGQQSNAKVILDPFNKVKAKRILIQELYKDYEEFDKFKLFVNEKRYFLAYPLANRHEHFKQSDVYKLMENEWHIKFNKAKTYLADKKGDEKVKKLLTNFKGISEKSILIQELFRQRTAYMLFKKKLALKDYKALFALLEKCPYIKEFDEYDKLLEYADNCYINAQHALDKKDYAKVVSYASQLLYFPDLQDDAKEMIDNAEVLEKFTMAFASDDIALMYEMIGDHPFLIELKEAKALEEDWNYHLVLAEKYASKADVVNAIASLEDFFDIKAKFNAIAVVMQQAYISQLNRALRSKKSQFVIQNSIKQYLVFFGVDDHIENYIENYIEFFGSSFDLSRLEKGNIELFRPSMIILDIVN